MHEDTWMNGKKMGVWVNAWKDRSITDWGWADKRLHLVMDGSLDARMDIRKDGWMDEWADVWMRCKDGWTRS